MAAKKVLNEELLKDEIIGVRCTSRQKAAIESVAKSEGMGASTWLLRLGLLAVETKGRQT
jgi:hypothetical protein